MGDRGSISIFAVGLLAVIGVALLLFGRMGADMVGQVRVSAVADVVALAAAAEPGSAAGVAAANGAELVSVVTEGFQVEVTVHCDGATAVARAEFLPPRWWCRPGAISNPVHFQSCPSIPVR